LCHVYEHPALWSYTRALYQMPGIATTCDIDQCKLHYLVAPADFDMKPLAPR